MSEVLDDIDLTVDANAMRLPGRARETADRGGQGLDFADIQLFEAG